MGGLNSATTYLESRDKKVVNFNFYSDDIGIDFNTDFFNITHLNVQGSTKYTLYLGTYLKSNYDIKGDQENKNHQKWEEAYKTYKAKYKEYTGKDYEQLLESVK